ncbi:hypothetical protein GWK47_053206 [Chionoecetes opilio]|uniref:Uncharacterized protein n=1 Tax=Chionoecetes opilio TaxID=41210 RepID=A0A8J5CQZ7_CHIOP|nr:hypothetical protein GWK47_053206 [Chionoecetes opilio]
MALSWFSPHTYYGPSKLELSLIARTGSYESVPVKHLRTAAFASSLWVILSSVLSNLSDILVRFIYLKEPLRVVLCLSSDLNLIIVLIQRRALQLVGIEEDQQSSAGVTSLEHRRDVSTLVVCHKAQVQEVPHLSSLRLPVRAVQRSRTTPLSDVLVKVPLSHSRQHQRPYTVRTSRLWNMFAVATPDVQDMNTHQVKLAAYKWRETKTSPLSWQGREVSWVCVGWAGNVGDVQNLPEQWSRLLDA